MKRFQIGLALLCGAMLLSPVAQAEEGGWADRISLSGDLRLRYEDIRQEGDERRTRGRYRARLALTAAVSDTVDIVMQLASGADNPVSRNVTFDGGFTTKDIGFDLAYVDWTPVDGMHVYAGKMKNPLYRAGGVPLIWDGDLNPEGAAVTYKRGLFFGNAGLFSVEERSSGSDSILSAAQAGARFAISDTFKLTAGAGYFGYSNTAGNAPFYDGSANGNSVDLAGNYINDYRNTELFAQLDTQVGDLPLRVYTHWTRNDEVDEQDTGIAYGARIGSAVDAGDWEFGWTYMDVEADAVVGTFSDSDFGGGGTDATGHILKAKYAVSKNIAVGGTYYSNEVNPFSLPAEDYERLQLDVEFRFN